MAYAEDSGSWRSEADEVVASTAAAVSGVVSLLEQIHAFPSAQRAPPDLTSAFSFILVPKAQQKQLAFTWEGQQYTLAVLHQG